MSTSENISLWKQRAKIDYFPLFISLWLSLNAWMRDHFSDKKKDRAQLELLKHGGHALYDTFYGLIKAENAKGTMFRGNFAELHRALLDANITYENRQDRIVSLKCCAIDWNNGQPNFESVLKGKKQHEKLQIDSDLWVENNPERLFAAYMEIVYQVRCTLIHGGLAPILQNERVIKHLYTTLSMVMEPI